MIRSNFIRLLTKPAQLQVYCYLLVHLDPETGTSPVSRPAIAAALDVTLRQTKDALEQLKKGGFIATAARGSVHVVPAGFGHSSGHSLAVPLAVAENANTSENIDDSPDEQGGVWPFFWPSSRRSSGHSPKNPPAPAAFSATLWPSSRHDETMQGPEGKEENRNQKDQEWPLSGRQDEVRARDIRKTKEKRLPPSDLVEVSRLWIEDSKKRHPSRTRSMGKAEILAGARALERLIKTWGYDLEKDIKPALRWARKDAWWSPNLLSLGRLNRRSENGSLKFENIALRMDQEKAGTVGGQPVRQVETISLDEYREQCGGKIKNSLAL